MDKEEEVRAGAASGTPGLDRSDPVLRMEQLVRVREGADVRFELHVPDLSIPRGAFAAVVGQSGCGKSTLLDILGMVLRPTEGRRFELRLKGEDRPIDVLDLWKRKAEGALADIRRLHLGYVLQTGGLFPFLTAEENIGLQAHLVGAKLDRERVRADARRLAIEAVLPKKPSLLSGGQRQRTAILRALSNDPAIVLADEPTAAVDEDRAKQIFAEFNDLAKIHGATVIVVTHAPSLVAPYADLVFRFELESEGSVTRSTCREGAL